MAGLLDWVSNRNLKYRIRQGIRVNLLPGLVLWALGASLVIIYYIGEFSRPWFNEIISLKETYGFAYSAVSTCIFGGLIPYVFMQLTGRDRLKGLGSGVIFLGYWAIRGIDVDAFYRLQAMVFGAEVDLLTIGAKVLVDQFVYCVVWASRLPLSLHMEEAGFSLNQWKGSKTWSELFDMILIFTVTTWVVWIPGSAIIYSLPYPLQIPLFNLTLCFFVILVSVFSQKKTEMANL